MNDGNYGVSWEIIAITSNPSMRKGNGGRGYLGSHSLFSGKQVLVGDAGSEEGEIATPVRTTCGRLQTPEKITVLLFWALRAKQRKIRKGEVH
jgi:hypothetical protein